MTNIEKQMITYVYSFTDGAKLTDGKLIEWPYVITAKAAYAWLYLDNGYIDHIKNIQKNADNIKLIGVYPANETI